MMKNLLIVSLLGATLVGLCPNAAAADCSPFDPGTPDGGVVGATQWYALQNGYLACQLANSVDEAAAEHGGDMAGKLGMVVTGAGALFNTSGLTPAATAYQSAASAAASSEVHDGCGALLGDANPTCGSDPSVSQTQTCPNGITIPNPVGGGLAGNTLVNSNGALQATCALSTAVAASIPNQAQLVAYANSTQATLLSLNGDVFDLGSSILDAACIYLTASTPCI